MTRAIVDGIDRYLAFQWKGLVCSGCGKAFEPTQERDKDGSKHRRAAALAGWQIGAGREGPDFCPACQV